MKRLVQVLPQNGQCSFRGFMCRSVDGVLDEKGLLEMFVGIRVVIDGLVCYCPVVLDAAGQYVVSTIVLLTILPSVFIQLENEEILLEMKHF
jgi:hypothetical protein